MSEEIKSLKEQDLINNFMFLMKSDYRSRVINTIGEGVKTPTNISKESDIRINHISIVLSDLKKKNIVECINEEMGKGRLYRLTEKGLIRYKWDCDSE